MTAFINIPGMLKGVTREKWSRSLKKQTGIPKMSKRVGSKTITCRRKKEMYIILESKRAPLKNREARNLEQRKRSSKQQ
jgi:hypothetical protein